MRLAAKMKCTFCNGVAMLMTLEDVELKKKLPRYYYHHSLDYSNGCHERIQFDNKERMKSLTKWTKDDEIKR